MMEQEEAVDSKEKPEKKKESEKKETIDRSIFFSHEDLTSDYFQSITRKQQPVWCKVIWGFIIIACIAFTTYTVYKLLSSYFDYKSYNQDSISWQSAVTLPALTICNLNVVNKEKWKTLNKEDPEMKELLSSSIKDVLIATKKNETLPDEFYDELMEKLDKIEIDGKQLNIMRDLHMEFSTFLIGNGENHPWMEFGDKWVDMNRLEYSYTNTQLGSCLALNDDQSFVQKIGGVHGGFTIDLNTKMETYLSTTMSAGFMLFLRMPYESLLIDMDGILLHPGKEAFVSLERQNIKRLGPPWGGCEDKTSRLNTSVPLTMRECIQMTYFIESLKFCECVPWYFVETVKNSFASRPEDFYTLMADNDLEDVFELKNIETDMCGFVNQVKCDLLVHSQLEEINIAALCHEPCLYSKWSHRTEISIFPATPSFYYAFLEGSAELPDLDDIEGYNDSYRYAVDNFLRLHVFYEDLKVTDITQTAAYDVFSFISEFGGSTDLLIGLSFFTVFQLIEMFIAYIIFKCFPRKKD